MPRYIVFGAGAIGSILGAALHRSGQNAVLVGRGPHVQAIRKDGLQLISDGVLRRIKVSAIEDLRALKPRPDDILLLTVKSQDTEAAARQLSGTYGPTTAIASLQNAVRNEEILARQFQQVYGGLVEFSGNYLSSGFVEHTRNNLVAIGRYPEGADATAERIAADLSTAGFRAECHPQVMNLKWWKLLLNVNNALLALLGCWLQRAHSDPDIYPLMADVMGESLGVLRSANIHPQAPAGLPPIETTIEKLRNGQFACEYDLPVEKRTYPSTWQDLRLQRHATEVDFLNGEIVRLGRNLGVSTPLNSILVDLIHSAVEHKDPPGKHTPAEIRIWFHAGKTG
jgi:2-dehydropantoate 2-reductase